LHQWMRLWLGSTLIAGLLPVAVAQTATSPGSEIREQAVTFHVGSIRLAGTLLTPVQKGPVPGIVLLAGSGPGMRSRLRLFAERFAKDGLAALIFDKRGSGESEGSWTEESLDDLADDALAAVAFLKSQPEINPQRVGVWGISQAGWVIPHAAARAPDAFAFAIVITGGGVKPLEVEMRDYSAALDHAGITGSDRAEAMALVDRYFTYLRTGDGRAGLEQAILASKEKPWFKVLNLDRVMPTEAARAKWEWVPTYDPSADIRTLKVPVLVVLGAKDRPSLSITAFAAWRSNLTEGNDSDATLVELLNAEHGAAVAGTHQKMHSGGPPTYVPGYLDLVDGWLRAHTS
jgi:pimeloyl-ACP methyl ester carboxylesterase